MKTAPPPPAQSEAGRRYDEWLVTLVQAGDREAGERLARRWHPRLLRTARRLLGDTDSALVAVQDSWIAILRGIGGLREGGAGGQEGGQYCRQGELATQLITPVNDRTGGP